MRSTWPICRTSEERLLLKVARASWVMPYRWAMLNQLSPGGCRWRSVCRRGRGCRRHSSSRFGGGWQRCGRRRRGGGGICWLRGWARVAGYCCNHRCRLHACAAHCAYGGRRQNDVGLERRSQSTVCVRQHSQHNHWGRGRRGAVNFGYRQAGGGVQHLASQLADPGLDARQPLLGAFLYGSPTARGDAD